VVVAGNIKKQTSAQKMGWKLPREHSFGKKRVQHQWAIIKSGCPINVHVQKEFAHLSPKNESNIFLSHTVDEFGRFVRFNMAIGLFEMEYMESAVEAD